MPTNQFRMLGSRTRIVLTRAVALFMLFRAHVPGINGS